MRASKDSSRERKPQGDASLAINKDAAGNGGKPDTAKRDENEREKAKADTAAAIASLDDGTDRHDGLTERVPLIGENDGMRHETPGYPATKSRYRRGAGGVAMESAPMSQPADDGIDGEKEAKRKKTVRIACAVGIPVVLLGAVYAAGAWYYSGHFYPNTTIDGVAVGGMTPKEAKNATKLGDGWTLTVKEDGKDDIVINASDISFDVEQTDTDKSMGEQNPFTWPLTVASGNTSDTEKIDVKYDEDKLDTMLREKLDAANEGRTQSTDATVAFDSGKSQYHVVPEVQGNVIDVDTAVEKIKGEMGSVKPVSFEIDSSLYIKPGRTKDDKGLNDSVSSANKMLETKIVYNIDGVDNALTVDASQIKDWISIGEDGQAHLDENKVKEFLGAVGTKWDTVGKEQEYHTANGKTVKLGGGSTGWLTDEATELKKLVADIKEGKTDSREFSYKQRGTYAADQLNPFGNTWIDIDLSSQYLWYVKDGTIQWGFPIISGKNGHSTPTGVTKVYGKKTDYTMISPWKDPVTGEPTYKTHVTVAVGITADWQIFVHSAEWQPSYGFSGSGNGDAGKAVGQATSVGNRSYYRGGGSHGCINARTSDAWRVYNEVASGTPVLTHN